MQIESEHMEIPEQHYAVSVRLPSAEFQKICRDLKEFGVTMTQLSHNKALAFVSKRPSVYMYNGKPMSVKNIFLHVEDGTSSALHSCPRRAASAPKRLFNKMAQGTIATAFGEKSNATVAQAPLKDVVDDAASEASTRADSLCCRRGSDESASGDDKAAVMLPNAEGNLTTVILKNLPENWKRNELVCLLEKEGFALSFDFVYVPVHFVSNSSFGYASINFHDIAEVQRFRTHFDGFTRWGPLAEGCTKVGEVGWSFRLQGLTANVNRYRNSRMMHETMLDDLKPAVFKDGKRVPFPPPTKALQVPRSRHMKQCPSVASGSAEELQPLFAKCCVYQGHCGSNI